MKRVLTAAVLIPLVLALVFRGPQWALALLAAVFGLLALHEYLSLVRAHGFESIGWPVYGASVLLYWDAAHAFSDTGFAYFISQSAFGRLLPIIVVTAFLCSVLALRNSDLRTALPSAGLSFFGFIYIAVPLVLLLELRTLTGARYGVFVLLSVVWSGDIFGYYFGRAFGRHKLAPTISPGKTWEGAIASVFGSVIVGVLLVHFENHVSWFLSKLALSNQWYNEPPAAWQLATAAVAFGMINVAAQLGDLFESGLKRGAGVKDSGRFLPGHGGVLDRIDALLFAAPIGWVIAYHWIIA